MLEFRTRISVVLAAVCLMAGPAASQAIVVQSQDGKISVNGDLINYDGESYTILTNVGEFTIPASDVSCISGACPSFSSTANIAVAGSNSIGKTLMPSLLSEFAITNNHMMFEQFAASAGNPTVKSQAEYVLEDSTGEVFANVSILSNGNESGFNALLDGSAEMVMSARAVRDDEKLAFVSLGLGDITTSTSQTIVALDALNILVSRDNPVHSLSIEQIAQIFAGQISNWSEVGGPDQAINVYRRENDAGTTNDFFRSVLTPRALTFSKKAITADNDTVLSAMVARDDFAIGYSGFAFENNARAIALRDNCGFPVRPTEFSIKTGEYPLSRRLYLYSSEQRLAATNDSTSAVTQDFVDFVQTNQAQQAVADAGFVNQDIIQLPIDAQGQRLTNALLAGLGDASYAELVDLTHSLRDAKRLSSTFRFVADSPILDAQSEQDIARLADYLGRTDMSGKELVFVGFTGSDGSATLNSQLARRSAAYALQVVSAEIGAAAINLNMVAEGYGEVAPLMCNNTVFGRALNQRVEIWIRDVAQAATL